MFVIINIFIINIFIINIFIMEIVKSKENRITS